MRDQLVLMLDGLDCAHCAQKIEDAAHKVPGVEVASVHFPTQRMRLTLKQGQGKDDVFAQVTALVSALEPSVRVARVQERQPSRPHEASRVWRMALLGLSFALFLLARMVDGLPGVLLYVLSYVLAGYDVLLDAARNMAKGRVFDENLLMGVASLSAMALGEYAEGVAVMLFYQVGEAFQARAVGKSRKSIEALLNIRPDSAWLSDGDGTRKVDAQTVAVGQVIQVRPGERIPLDGEVLSGEADLDTSALTGEAMPRHVAPGDQAFSGCVVQNGLLTLRVKRVFSDSTVSRILAMVEEASEKKAPTEQFITRFARIYTPAVVLAAALLAILPPLLVPGAQWSDWIHRAMTFLVVSCPCALVISVPLGYFGGIGAASRQGVLVKGSDALDALCEVTTLAMDKTGTLTKGAFSVTQILPASPETRERLLLAAATAEQASNHPIAQAVVAAAKDMTLPALSEAHEIPGKGVRSIAAGQTLLAGSASLMTLHGVKVQEPQEPLGSVVYVARDGQFLGCLVVADTLKPEAAASLSTLRAMGIRRMVMMTGDGWQAARHVGEALSIDEIHAQLLPEDKLSLLSGMCGQDREKVAFVGDGINDAPVLARADVGIAMGGLGADAAIQAADVVLMDDSPKKIASAVAIARKTRQIVMQNIVFALAVKGAVLLLSALGYANMWAAVFADVGVSLLAILNAMRTLKAK